MVESRSSSSATKIAASSSLDSTIDPRILPTMLEHKTSFGSSQSPRRATLARRQSSTHRSRSRGSHEGSPTGYTVQVYSEKPPEHVPQRLRRKEPKARTQRPRWSSVLNADRTSISVHDGPNQETAIGTPPRTKKPKSGGLRGTFRRLFGKKSSKDRISLPAPVPYPQHDPNEFITSAVDVSKTRSASVPTQTVLPSSALGSHSPFTPKTAVQSAVEDTAIPPRPERSPPKRPRRASLPSVVLNPRESKIVGDQLKGLGLLDGQEQGTDTSAIGFAVTSGSNPKRRSRSADNLRDTAKEHRMSPIQWRRWRRRSDEIRYWRESGDGSSASLAAPESRQPSPDRTLVRRQGFVEQTPPLPREEVQMPEPEPEAGDFNFDLQPEDLQNQERIGIEERLVTLEIKLMDFEYTISRLQSDMKSVDVKSPTEDISQHYVASPQLPSNPSLLQPPSRPAIQASPTSNYDQSPESTPGIQQLPFGIHHPSIQPRPRPTSIATTLKPARGDRISRNSMTELTIEHYTTLITLIRREQSARIRLEDHVAMLEEQLQKLKPPSPGSLRDIREARHHYPSPMSDSRYFNLPDEHRRYSPEETRRQFSRDSNERFLMRQREYNERSRSRSNYDETDTDDEAFHEVYVTPVERGEFEGHDLEEEGLAF